MATSATSLPLPFASLLVIPKSQPCASYKPCSPVPSVLSFSILPPICHLRRASLHPSSPTGISLKRSWLWRVTAASGDILPSETPIEPTQQIVPISDDGTTSTIISSLLFIAFIVLSILTVGVIYIAVQDFLQKRERDKFEKEEAANKKKGGKKVKVRARTGPRGFGQKIEEDDD